MSKNSPEQDLLESLVRTMVAHPADVSSEQTTDELGVLLSLHVNQEDMGLVLGRRGHTIGALRDVFGAIGARAGIRLSLRVHESAEARRAHEERRNAEQMEEIGESQALATTEPEKLQALPVTNTPRMVVSRAVTPQAQPVIQTARPIPDMSTLELRLAAVEMRFDVEFKNKLLLVEALTHRSYLNENPLHPTGHNERLEFLGDAALQIAVTEMLYRIFKDKPEGDLTNYRAALVRADTLGPLWESLGLWGALFLSKGEIRESNTNAKSRKYICANAFEAVIGAIHQDQGIGVCRMTLDHLLLTSMKRIIAETRDYKSEFQEVSQARFQVTPHYLVLEENGPDHNRIFTISCMLGTIQVATASGDSKGSAQTAAAKVALETISQWESRIAEATRNAPTMRRSSNRTGGK